MSLILDALRKMEQDRNSRRGAALDIRPAVLRYRVAAKPQRSTPYLPLALGMLLLACGIGAGFFLKGTRWTSVTQENGPLVPVLPPLPAPAPSATQPLPVAHAVTPNPVRHPDATVFPARPEPAATRLPMPVPRDAPAAVQTAPELSVSGIAWQDEHRLRRAVLNGTLVGEGAELAGVRVVEIREDKVRLSRGGQVFEVRLSSGFSPR